MSLLSEPMLINNKKSCFKHYSSNSGDRKRTKKESKTSSGNKCADNRHHTAVLVFIREIGSNDTEDKRAGIWWHLVTTREKGETLGDWNKRTVNNCV